MADATLSHGSPLMVDHTPTSDVSAGDVLVIDGRCRIAHLDIEANALGAVAASGGVYSVTKNSSSEAWADGVTVYWDAGNSVATTDSDGGDNKRVGNAVGAAGATDAVGLIEHTSD